MIYCSIFDSISGSDKTGDIKCLVISACTSTRSPKGEDIKSIVKKSSKTHKFLYAFEAYSLLIITSLALAMFSRLCFRKFTNIPAALKENKNPSGRG